MSPAGDSLLPWLAPAYRRLLAAHRAGRLGHALLIRGPRGIGKRWLAARLAQACLCASPAADGDACGRCADCRLAAAGTHPDAAVLCPDAETGAEEIRVDQVRALCGRESLTPTRAASKVLQVVPAEAMNAFAANALLKTLEEPAASTLWLLVSEQPQRLSATIRSRCQQIALAPAREQEASEWLQARLGGAGDPLLALRLAHGAPLAALELLGEARLALRARCFEEFAAVGAGQRDPVAVAAAWQSLDAALVLDLLAEWLCDLLRLEADPHTGQITNIDQRAGLVRLAQRIDRVAAHRLLRRLLRARELAAAPINRQILFESLLVRWAWCAAGDESDAA